MYFLIYYFLIPGYSVVNGEFRITNEEYYSDLGGSSSLAYLSLSRAIEAEVSLEYS